jgi:ribonuclease HI
MKLAIYTDGSFWNKVGGWSAVFVATHKDKKMVKYISGFQVGTTSNRMEITAVIRAIQALQRSKIGFEKVRVLSDSQYVINSINEWLDNWLKKGKTMKNMDLWHEYKTAKSHVNLPIKFNWIRGHAGDEYNELADKLAGEARVHKINTERLTNL